MTKGKKRHKLEKEKRLGRPILYDQKMEPYAIKLPDYMVDWLNRHTDEGVSQSEALRRILQKLEKYEGVLPADPGTGKTVRSSYALPEHLLEVAERRGRGRGYTIGIRRAIRADIAGLLNGLDKPVK